MKENDRPQLVRAELHVFQSPCRGADARSLPDAKDALLVTDLVEAIAAR
jgi:hypothetical protein